MQKYFITDGKRYVLKSSNGKYIFRDSPSMADEFTYKQGENVIKNHLKGGLKKEFYLEGIDDFKKIDINSIKKEKTAAKAEDQFQFDMEIVQQLESLVGTITTLNVPALNHLLAMRSDLEQANQFYDQALADIDHWIMNHTPPADVRTKVYGRQHDIEIMRREVKEKWAYVNVFIKAKQENYTFEKLQYELKNAKWKPYTPNTYIYKELDELLLKRIK